MSPSGINVGVVDASSYSYVGGGAPRFFLPLDQQLRNPNYAQLLIMANDQEATCGLCMKSSRTFAIKFFWWINLYLI